MPTTQEQLAIQAIVTAKNIPYLVHFTRVENLPSILQHGLQPRSVVDDANQNKNNILFGKNIIFNDSYRVDYKREYNCLSVSFPNWRMFWGCRQNSGGNWVVLLLHPKILWAKESLFYPTNDATGSVSTLRIHNFNNSIALANMFGGQRDQNMCDHDPTDVQAEVMVQGIIAPQYVGYCLFQDLALLQGYQALFPTVNMIYHSAMYSKREYARSNLGFIR